MTVVQAPAWRCYPATIFRPPQPQTPATRYHLVTTASACCNHGPGLLKQKATPHPRYSRCHHLIPPGVCTRWGNRYTTLPDFSSATVAALGRVGRLKNSPTESLLRRAASRYIAATQRKHRSLACNWEEKVLKLNGKAIARTRRKHQR